MKYIRALAAAVALPVVAALLLCGCSVPGEAAGAETDATPSESIGTVDNVSENTAPVVSPDSTAETMPTESPNVSAPVDASVTDGQTERVGFAPDALTADTSVGIEVLLDYADDDIVVFHGYFGVFIYDLNECAITNAVDFTKTLGCTNINGSVVVCVAVSDDGKTVQLYLAGMESEMLDMGFDPDTAWYLDTESGTVTRDVYEQITSPFTDLVVSNQPGASTYMGVEFPDGMAYISYNGTQGENSIGTLSELTYVRGDMVWPLFDGYF